MKKIFLSLLIVIFLASCGGKKNEAPEEVKEPEAIEEVAPATEETSAEEMEEAEEETPVVEESKPVLNEKPQVVAKSEWTGYVTKLQGVAMGKTDALSADDAKASFKTGETLVFYSGGKAYLVYNTDGSMANKNLAKNAGNDLTISGKMMSVKGINVILAEKFN